MLHDFTIAEIKATSDEFNQTFVEQWVKSEVIQWHSHYLRLKLFFSFFSLVLPRVRLSQFILFLQMFQRKFMLHRQVIQVLNANNFFRKHSIIGINIYIKSKQARGQHCGMAS